MLKSRRVLGCILSNEIKNLHQLQQQMLDVSIRSNMSTANAAGESRRLYQLQHRMLDGSIRSYMSNTIDGDDGIIFVNNNTDIDDDEGATNGGHGTAHESRGGTNHSRMSHSTYTSAGTYSDYTSGIKDTSNNTNGGDIEVPSLAEPWWLVENNSNSNITNESISSHRFATSSMSNSHPHYHHHSSRSFMAASEANDSFSNRMAFPIFTDPSNSNSYATSINHSRNWWEMLMLPFFRSRGDRLQWTTYSVIFTMLMGSILIVGLFILLVVAFKQVRDL